MDVSKKKNVISIGLNVPKDVQEGMVYDVKQVLRKLYLFEGRCSSLNLEN